MKGYFTVAKTGCRIYLGGVFINPGETSRLIEVPKTQIEWILNKIRNREVSFVPFDAKAIEHNAAPPNNISLPVKKVTPKPIQHKRISLPASIPSVTVVVVDKSEPLPAIVPIIIEEEPVIEETIIEEAPTIIEEEPVENEVSNEATVDETVEFTETHDYNEDEKRAEYKELLYNQLYAKCRAYNVEMSGRPKKDELIELLIAAKV